MMQGQQWGEVMPNGGKYFYDSNPLLQSTGGRRREEDQV